MKRKFDSIDPMKLAAKLKRKEWRAILERAMNKSSMNSLIKWRYGLQAGLADANSRGKVTTEEIDVWVIARIKDIENAMKHILRERHPNPMDNPLNTDLDTQDKCTEAKRKRDREFQSFLMRSNF